MLKSIHNTLLVTLRDVITYETCLSSNLENCKPAFCTIYVCPRLGKQLTWRWASRASSEEAAAVAGLTDPGSYLPGAVHRLHVPSPLYFSCLNGRALFWHGRCHPDRVTVLCCWSLTHCLSSVLLHTHLVLYSSLYASKTASKCLFLVTTWRILI